MRSHCSCQTRCRKRLTIPKQIVCERTSPIPGFSYVSVDSRLGGVGANCWSWIFVLILLKSLFCRSIAALVFSKRHQNIRELRFLFKYQVISAFQRFSAHIMPWGLPMMSHMHDLRHNCSPSSHAQGARTRPQVVSLNKSSPT